MTQLIKMISIPEDELKNLKVRIRGQAHEITKLREVLERKNKELDALHFVWCNGGCPYGIHRHSEVKLTEELILKAERNTRRMRSWYNTVKWRLTSYPTMSEWHVNYAMRAAKRTDLINDDTAD